LGQSGEKEVEEKSHAKSFAFQRSFSSQSGEDIYHPVAKYGTEREGPYSGLEIQREIVCHPRNVKGEKVRRERGKDRAAWGDHTPGNEGDDQIKRVLWAGSWLENYHPGFLGKRD
jgi:hypothetical protein